MDHEIKATVLKAATFDLLDIRLGRVISAIPAPGAPKKAYMLEIDFGKFGKRTSVGRFTQHSAGSMIGKQVLAVLNFDPVKIGDTDSEVLVLGVQFPKADSGEATFITPCAEAKIGSKLF